MFFNTLLRAVAVTGLLAMTPMFAVAQTVDPTQEKVELAVKLALLHGQAEPMIAYYTEVVRPFVQNLQTPFDEEFFKKQIAELGIAADDPLVREFEQEARAFYAQQQAAIRRRVTSLIEQVALLEASVRGDYVRAERALTLATKLDPENTMYQAELEAVQRLRALHRQEQGRP